MNFVVVKFGGTSVSTRKNWDNIVKIVKNHCSSGLRPIIVCSALTKASNRLEHLLKIAISEPYNSLYDELLAQYVLIAKELEVDSALIQDDLLQLQQWLTGVALLKEASPKICAQVMSLGELMLTKIAHAFLEKTGIKVAWVDARRLIAVSDEHIQNDFNRYLSAICDNYEAAGKIDLLNDKNYDAVITQGFIASNNLGETVLLGRGGSDTTASILAAMTKAKRCEIWTDVPGIYTANPHQLPHARLLKQINYDEAQEIASMGGKVLHPNCLPPVKKYKIPMAVKFTQFPEHPGTLITNDSDENAPLIKSVLVKQSITLISMDTLEMWHQVGFLADAFAVFKKYGFSVDLLSSSEFNITVSLDILPHSQQRKTLEKLVEELNTFCRAKIIEPCSAVSLVGHKIRTVLPRLGSVLEVFEAKKIYLMALASNDLNLTFVVDESQANQLCQRLHNLLIESNPQSFYYSKSWHEEFGNPPQKNLPWWEQKRDVLLDLAANDTPCYVYSKEKLVEKINMLKSIQAIDKWFYAIKANANKDLLRTIHEHNIGFECVSLEEVNLIKSLFNDLPEDKLLFTPNFAPMDEYIKAMDNGAIITIDSLYPLENWGEAFTGRKVFLRIDPGSGAGHHKYVCTGGNESKFGITKEHLEKVVLYTKKHNIEVVGLHAHSGSGILSTNLWQETALMLIDLIEMFPKVRILNLGGGLGIADTPGQAMLDLEELGNSLQKVKAEHKDISFWMEPGRFFVSECGVILAQVTQCKEKGKVRFVGINTGMNSLIRPALYGSYHEIVNLSRLHEQKFGFYNIVGPICESSDTLGYDRFLPYTKEGDIILIANAGAYGYCMSSNYNMRKPAKEININ